LAVLLLAALVVAAALASLLDLLAELVTKLPDLLVLSDEPADDDTAAEPVTVPVRIVRLPAADDAPEPGAEVIIPVRVAVPVAAGTLAVLSPTKETCPLEAVDT